MRKKTGNKLHTWEAALLLAVAAALLWGACTLQRQDALEQKVIRLHVIANSDSEADQALKLRVRDRVLVLTEDILRQSGDMEEARQRLAEALPRLQQTAAEEIAAQGSRYTVSAGLEETEFPTREYDGFALPSGEYLALRVVIGEGAGKNWWCVVFPPLCTTAACDFQETAVSRRLGGGGSVPHHRGGRRLRPAVPGGGALGGPAPVAGKALTTEEGRRDGDSAWSGEAMQL